MRKSMRSLLFPMLAVVLWMTPWGWVAAADAATEIALVKTVEGAAVAIRGAVREPLSVGSPLFLHDAVETAEGSVGVTFKDGTRISLGPRSRLELRKYAYVPAQHNLEFLVGLMRGTMLYVSGLIAKLAPERTQVETPVATVAVRGTRFVASVEN